MHEKFQHEANSYYYNISQTVSEHLRGVRDGGFEQTAGFVLGNPAVIAVGQHQLVRSGLHQSEEGSFIQQDTVVAAQPFVTIFGTPLLAPKDLGTLVKRLQSDKGDIIDDLSKLPKIDPSHVNKDKFSLLGVTFSTLFDPTVDDGVTTLVPAKLDTPESPFHLAAYGYAGLAIDPGRFAGDVGRTIRFFGGRQDLVLPDGLPIDVKLGEKDSAPPTQLEDFSLVKYQDPEHIIFGRSEPKPFAGQLKVVNQILDTKLATDFSPELILGVMRTVLR